MGLLDSIKPTEAKGVENLRHLVLYGLPKVGKTTIVSKLPNVLIIGFEKGVEYVDGYKIRINSYKELREVLIELGQDKKFDFVVFDTVTTMLEVLKERAEELYSNTIMGKNWLSVGKKEYGDILNLPKGAGYGFLKEALLGILEYTENESKFVKPKRYIWLAHSKEIVSDSIGGYDIRFKDIDLPANIKSALSVRAGAIGYLKRKAEQLEISFISNNDYLAGCQVKHLSGKIITISEETEDGTIKTYWEKIYSDLENNETKK